MTADENDLGMGPGSDDDDDGEIAAPARSETGTRSGPPPLIDLRKGSAPAAPAAPPSDGSDRPAIVPKGAGPAAIPATPAAPAERPAQTGPFRLVSDAPAEGAPSPAPAKDTPSAPASTAELAAQLASLQSSIASLTSRVDQRTPAPAAPAAAPAAPEAAEPEPTELDEKAVERDLATFAEKDRDCVAWSEEFTKNDARIKELAKPDGEYAVLGRAIGVLQAQLDPKKFGIGDEVPDDVTRAEIEAKLEPKLAKAERLRLEYERLVDKNEKLTAKFNGRIQLAEEKIRERFQTKAQSQRQDRARTEQVAGSEREWNAAFKAEVLDRYDGLTDGEGKPNADALTIFNRLVERCYAQVTQNPDLDFSKFIRSAVGDEILVLNARRGQANTETARVKAADSRIPAPRGPAAVAVAPRPLSEITDPRERRREVDRQTARASTRLTLHRAG